MNVDAAQWYLLGGVFSVLGIAMFTVTQVMLNRWRRRMERE